MLSESQRSREGAGTCRDLFGLTLRLRSGLPFLVISCRNPIVLRRLEWMLLSLNSTSLSSHPPLSLVALLMRSHDLLFHLTGKKLTNIINKLMKKLSENKCQHPYVVSSFDRFNSLRVMRIKIHNNLQCIHKSTKVKLLHKPSKVKKHLKFQLLIYCIINLH